MFAAADLAPYLRSAVAALVAVAAVFVVVRRLAGALNTPLGAFPLVVAGLLLAVLAWTARAPIHRGRSLAAGILISLAVLALAVSLSLRGSHPVALLLFWTAIVGGELLAWRKMLPLRWPAGKDLPVRPPLAPLPADGDLSAESEPLQPEADILQQLTLRATAEGGQELSGWLRVRLVAGQRMGSLHVAFCPSFAEMPRVQAEAVSGPDCRIKAAQVLPYGARLDVKLDEPATSDENVLVWFFAASGGSQQS
jgi:hypothetical protein